MDTENTPEITRHQKKQLEQAEKDRARAKHEKKGGSGKIIGTIVVLGILGLIIWAVSGKTSSTPVGNANDVRTEDHIKGLTTAPVTLIEYSDFQCPACAAYFSVVKQLEEAFPKDLRVVYRHYPLTQVHQNALGASLATEAAAKQNKFWEMHDVLFSRQRDWSTLSNPTDKFLEYAKELGMNEAQFTTDTASNESKDRIKADQSLANRLNIQSTPTFYLNGVELNNPQGFEPFKKLVEAAITAAPTQAQPSTTTTP